MVRSRRGHSLPAVSACPKKAFIPVPEYWMDLGLPMALCALLRTLLASLAQALVTRPRTTTRKCFFIMIFSFRLFLLRRLGGARKNVSLDRIYLFGREDVVE